jgi:hypothetical protein
LEIDGWRALVLENGEDGGDLAFIDLAIVANEPNTLLYWSLMTCIMDIPEGWLILRGAEAVAPLAIVQLSYFSCALSIASRSWLGI